MENSDVIRFAESFKLYAYKKREEDMSSERIIEAAVREFAKKGYKGATLAQIAQDIGVRKPSLYAHFTGKKSLFLSIMARAQERELNAIEGIKTSSGIGALREYLENILARAQKDDFLAFWLRAVYLPPDDMTSEIAVYDESYAHNLDCAIEECLYAAPELKDATESRKEVFSSAYAGIIRAVHAEPLYHGLACSRSKAEALWQIFMLALKN